MVPTAVLGPLLDRLRTLVGADHVLTDADLRAGYERDWTGRFVGATPAVVRPGTAAEVAGVVEACRLAGVAVVAQGGNTGLVGGSVPLGGELVVSLRRLRRLDPVDELDLSVIVGAGVTLAELQAHAAAAGLEVGVDLAARDSATVGGMVATNAGGLRFVRHGGMRQQLLGIEAVLGDGSTVSRLDSPPKDNVGYDLAGLLCGSEGTLGLVTAARLRLVPPPREVQTALVGTADLAGALAVVAGLRRAGVAVEAAEGFFDAGLELVRRHTGLPRPMPASPAYLLVEWDGPVDALAAVDGLDPEAVVVASGASSRDQLWRYREAHTEAVNGLGVPHKLDVAVDPRRLDELAAAVTAAARAVDPTTVVVLFGHVADGNLHVNLVGPAPDDDRPDDRIAAVVAGMGGSISAEHGIGTAKRRWLSLARTPAELGAYRALRRAFDPAGILNPNAGC
ncbi:MAG: FAD-binding oxidoreductase [Acidimicrobiia bacterium]